MTGTTLEDTYPANLPRRTDAEWRALHDTALTANYGPRRLAIVRGAGSRVWTADGRELLDFLTGISVDNLGHCHPRITEAIREQAGTLVHCSNLYYVPIQIELARYLLDRCFGDRVFFGNSGAEANEGAIKMARRWSYENKGEDPERTRVVTMLDSFHGRTHATMSATGQEKIRKHFFPVAQGFDYATFNDLASVERAVTDKTCAVMLEPVQGEGGVRPATPAFLEGVRALCDARGLALIFDEVQCGLGRAGRLFAHERYGVTPDIMTLAKSLGGGLAMGAVVAREPFASAFGVGAHASTMGGNALTSAAALAYLKELVEGDHSAAAERSGLRFMELVRAGLAGFAGLKEVRGLGLMIGVEVASHGPEIVAACEADGLLLNCTAGNVLRLLPPLNVSGEDLRLAADILVRHIVAILGGVA